MYCYKTLILFSEIVFGKRGNTKKISLNSHKCRVRMANDNPKFLIRITVTGSNPATAHYFIFYLRLLSPRKKVR